LIEKTNRIGLVQVRTENLIRMKRAESEQSRNADFTPLLTITCFNSSDKKRINASAS
jgi:hypothetical protein